MTARSRLVEDSGRLIERASGRNQPLRVSRGGSRCPVQDSHIRILELAVLDNDAREQAGHVVHGCPGQADPVQAGGPFW